MIEPLLQRLVRRRRATVAAGVVFHSTSRVFNIAGDLTAISIGRMTHIRGELLTFAHGGRIAIGEHCYIGEATRIWSARSIRIGDRVLIAHNVTVLDNLTHPISATARHEHFKRIITTGHPLHIDLDEQPVDIGDDAWIGCMSVVLRGVCVGQGAIVGAGSVVTDDVPAWTIAAGNPARVVRELRSDER